MQDNIPPLPPLTPPLPGDPQGLPAALAIFPLDGVLLLPRSQLPLNIFEPRYLAMVEDALKSARLIGMIQRRENGALYRTGCAGRITGFSETSDGRYLITLTGLSRFHVRHELAMERGYRLVAPDWQDFSADLGLPRDIGLDRDRLKKLLGQYFTRHGLSCDWDMIEHTPETKLVNCLSMICPLGATEKQALLEAVDTQARAEMFLAMLELDMGGENGEPPSRH